ncbi:hypothetical protein BG005_005737 [Podila minutissima]|nr:hypothetical protein BG005_005737 [Podila minutissima]
MATNTMVANTILTVNCAIPEVVGGKFEVTAYGNFNLNSTWMCTLTNQSPQLEISLVPRGLENYLQALGVKSLRIVSREGTVVHSTPVNGVETQTVMTAKVRTALVQVKQRLDFDIVVSTCDSIDVLSKPKVEQDQVPKSQFIMPSLLKDIPTMNMAFTFGFNGSARNVALWAHQSILSHQPNMSSFMSKLQYVEDDPSSPEVVCGVKTAHVTEYSLEAYCALIRYLYTSEIELGVDMDDFAIGRPPNKPFSSSCKERPEVDGIFAPAISSSSSETPTSGLKRTTTWQELYSVADCYGVEDLRMFCRGKVVESITDQNALKVYFEFAYKYEDVKAIVLEHVYDSMDKLFAADGDPFEMYKDHPEKHSLMIKVMQRKFNAMT